MSREANASRGPGPITPTDILRQAVVIVLVLAVWSAILIVFLGLTQPGDAPAAASPQPTEVVVASTATAQPTAVEVIAASTATAGPPATGTGPLEETAEATASEVPAETPEATLPPPTPTATSAEVTGISFAGDVHPILTSRCERCHGSQRAEGGFRVSTYADIVAGTADGPVVVPGSAATSRLIELIVSGEMPRRAPRLPDEEIQIISDWIDAGALDN